MADIRAEFDPNKPHKPRRPHYRNRTAKQKPVQNNNVVQHKRASLLDVNETNETAQAVENNSNNQLKLRRRRKYALDQKKEEIIGQLDFADEKKAYLNTEKHLLGGMFYLTLKQEDIARFLRLNDFINKDSFYNALDAAIFEALQNEYNNVRENPEDANTLAPIDIAKIDSDIRNSQQEEIITLYNDVNNIAYLTSLFNDEVNSLNILTNAQLLQRYYNRRVLIKKTIDFASNINVNDSAKAEEQFAKLSRTFNQLVLDNDEDNTLQPAMNEAIPWMTKIQHLYNHDIVQEGLSLGYYTELNKVLNGLRKGQMITVGARPAMGKTAYALNLINQTLENDDTFKQEGRKPVVALFSLEMNTDEILERYASIVTGTPTKDIRTGNVTPSGLNDLILFMKESIDGLYINDNPNITTADIENQLMKVKQQNNNHLDLVVIDYLQLINGATRSDNRQQEVSQISRDIKKIAKTLDVPIISLVQLSRSLEMRQDKRPILSDIRESGSIEQDSDVVMFLYRDDYYENNTDDDETSNDNGVSRMEVIIAKNRQGERNTVPFVFDKPRSRFIQYDENDPAINGENLKQSQ